MSSFYFAGIDPGWSGAIVMIDESRKHVWVWDCPKDVDAMMAILRTVKQFAPALTIIETVGVRAGENPASQTKFATNYGAWLGGLSSFELKYRSIVPQQWQRGILTESQGDTKTRSLLAARAMSPDPVPFARKMDHNRADAFCLAVYAHKAYLGLVP